MHFQFFIISYLEDCGRRAKLSEIWSSGLSSQCTGGNFSQLNAKGYSGVIQCISNFRQAYILYISKMSGRRVKFEPRGEH